MLKPTYIPVLRRVQHKSWNCKTYYLTALSERKAISFCRGDHVKGHVRVEVSEDETEASAFLPGFSYNDFNRVGEHPFPRFWD